MTTTVAMVAWLNQKSRVSLYIEMVKFCKCLKLTDQSIFIGNGTAVFLPCNSHGALIKLSLIKLWIIETKILLLAQYDPLKERVFFILKSSIIIGALLTMSSGNL